VIIFSSVAATPKRLTLPWSEGQARALEVGDELLVTGRIFTAREAAHRALLARDEPRFRALAQGSLVYHCGPVMSCDGHTRAWRVLAAGPTSSIRQEPYEADVIARYGLRGVLGEGGMGPRTLAALARHGAVYLHAVKGLAVALARHVSRVHGAHLLDELGFEDAIWCVEVEDFPAVVTMDARGRSLHAAAAAPDAEGELLAEGTPAA
jgi:fumarate hydratase subunit beta